MVAVSNTCEGTPGAAVSTSNSGGPNQFGAVLVTGAGNTLTYDGTFVHSGSTALKFAIGATPGQAQVDWPAASLGGSFQTLRKTYYLAMSALPGANARTIAFIGAGSLRAALQLTTAGLFRLLNNVGSVIKTSTTVMPLGQVIRVEFDVVGHPTAGAIVCRLFLNPAFSVPTEILSASAVNTGGLIDTIRLGPSTAVTNTTMWIDDPSVTDADTALAGELMVAVVADMQPGVGVNAPPSVVAAQVVTVNPKWILLPGDVVNDGTAAQYGFFDQMYGALKSVINPVPGNHDWVPGNLAAYDAYWGAGGHPPDHWYSFDLPNGWHVVALESDSANVGAPSVGSAQYAFLAADLQANQGKPTLAYWHHPRWSDGVTAGTGDTAAMADVWDLLRDHGVDLVLVGHCHSYQRFPKLGKTGQADPRGIRELVVGTGGSGLFDVNPTRTEGPCSGMGPFDQLNSQWFGHLRLYLTAPPAASYRWEFVSQNGQVLDSGGPVLSNTVPVDTGLYHLTAGAPLLTWQAGAPLDDLGV